MGILGGSRAIAVLVAVALATALLLAVPDRPATAQGDPGVAPAPPLVPTRDGPAATDRLAGPSRIDTAAAIALAAFPDGASEVFLARADVLADALAAGSLTTGPVLLVPSCGDVPAVVADAVDDLDPRTVTALGGEPAVCQDLLDDVAGGRLQARLAGGSRIETALAIAGRQFPGGAGVAYLAEAGDDAPDAVAGGGLVAGPLLLVPGEGPVPAAVADEIARLDPDRVVALGGTAVIADDVLEGAGGDRPVGRLAGPDRFATSAQIARDVHGVGSATGLDAPSAYLARGDVFADAVAAGALTDGPVLLVPSCGELPEPAVRELERLQPTTVTALGGEDAVCDEVLDAAAAVQRPEAVLQDRVVELDADAAAALVARTDDQLVFDADGAPDVTAGDALVGYDPDAGAVQVEVLDVTTADGQVRLAVEPAAAEDLLDSPLLLDRRRPTPDDLFDVETADGVTFDATGGAFSQDGCDVPGVSAASGTFRLDNVILYDGDGDPTTTGDQIVASGAVTFDIEPHLLLEVDGLEVQELRVGGQVSLDSSVTVQVGENVSAEARTSLGAARFGPFLTPSAPPIPYFVRVPIDLVARASAGVALSVSAQAEREYSAGIAYTRIGQIGGSDGWERYGEVNRSTTAPSVDLAGTFSVRTAIEGGMEVLVGGLAGPRIGTSIFVEGSGSTSATPAWSLEAGWDVRGTFVTGLPPGIAAGLPRPSVVIHDDRFTLLTAEGPAPDSGSGDVDLDPRSLDPLVYEHVGVATPTTDPARGVQGLIRQVTSSDDGRFVAFSSNASNLVATPLLGAEPVVDDVQVFDPYLYDVEAGELFALPRPAGTDPARFRTDVVLVTGAGTHVVYTTNVSEEEGTRARVWRYAIGSGTLQELADLPPDTHVSDGSQSLTASADGSVVAVATTLTSDPSNGLLVWDAAGTPVLVPPLPHTVRRLGGQCAIPSRFAPLLSGDGTRLLHRHGTLGGVQDPTYMAVYDLEAGRTTSASEGSSVDLASALPLAIDHGGRAIAHPHTPLEDIGDGGNLVQLAAVDGGERRLVTLTEGGPPDRGSRPLAFADLAGALLLTTDASTLVGTEGPGLYAYRIGLAGFQAIRAAGADGELRHLAGEGFAASADLRRAVHLGDVDPQTGERGVTNLHLLQAVSGITPVVIER